MSKEKGDYTEQQVRDAYTKSGYVVETPNSTGYAYDTNEDYWNLFDGMAFNGIGRLRFYQAKTNGATGIREWCTSVKPLERVEGVVCEYVVREEGEGYRVLRPVDDGHMTVCDERSEDCAMGEGLVEYLRDD